MKRILLIISISLIAFQQCAQNNYGEFKVDEFVLGKDTLFYRIFYPDDMKSGEKYPLILHLHGSGSRGKDNWRQLIHGSKFLRDKQARMQYPAVVIFPQCSKGVMWTHRQKHQENGKWKFEFTVKKEPPLPTKLTNMLVEHFMSKSFIDTSRVYILGMSMGGMGTLEFLYRWPEKYAAAAVVCGGHNPQLTKKYCHIPIWFFHGEKDRTVPMKYSKAVFDNLKNCNKNTKYTSYPKVYHNSWDFAYNADLLKWLMQFKK